MKTRKQIWIIALISLAFAFGGFNCQPPAKQDKNGKTKTDGGKTLDKGTGPVVAEFKGGSITLDELNEELSKLRVQNNLDQKKRLLDRMIMSKLTYQEGLNRGYGEDPEVVKQLKEYKKMLISRKIIKEITTAEVEIPEEELKAYFEQNKAQFEEVQIKNIQFRVLPNATDKDKKAAKKKAMDAIKKLKDGADFSKLAMEISEDPASKSKGGEMRPLKRNNMFGVELFNAANALTDPGDISEEPIESRFGYHVIQLTAKSSPDFNQASEEIKRLLSGPRKRAQYEGMISKLKEDSGLKINEELLASAGSEPKTGPGQLPPGGPGGLRPPPPRPPGMPPRIPPPPPGGEKPLGPK